MAPECKCAYIPNASALTLRHSGSTLTEPVCNLAYMASTIASRIIEAREAVGLDKAGLQRAVRPYKLTHSALSQLESGKSKSMKAETALAIARATGFRIEYLVLGELPARRDDLRSAQNVHRITPRSATVDSGRHSDGTETGINVEYLQFILEQAAELRGWSSARRAAAVAHVYDEITKDEKTPTPAAVLKLLRSA